jgi:O-antigen ligase
VASLGYAVKKPKFRLSPLQWTIAGVVGGGLGGCVLGFSWLPNEWAGLFALAVVAPFALLIVGELRRPLLALVILDTMLQLDTNFFYRYDAAARGALAGLSLSLTTMCLAALYALWFSELLARRNSPPQYLWRMVLPVAAYLAVVILSAIVASDPQLASFEIAMLVQTFLLVVYIVGTVKTREDVTLIVTMLLVCVLLQSLSMIYVFATGHEFRVAGISTRSSKSYVDTHPIRPGGMIGSPIDAATYLSLLMAPVLSVLLTRLRWFYKGLALFALATGAVALVLALSRGSWTTFFLSSVIVCFFAWRRGWLPLTIPLVFGSVTLLFIGFFQASVMTRLFGNDGGSAAARIPLIMLALHIIRDHPFLGVGANNYAVVISQYLTPEFDNQWIWIVHSKFLLVLAENGPAGLLAFLWFLLATLRRGWQTWKVGDRLLSPIALGFTAAIGSQIQHMLVDVFHSRAQVQILWLAAALIAVMYNMARKSS